MNRRDYVKNVLLVVLKFGTGRWHDAPWSSPVEFCFQCFFEPVDDGLGVGC